MLGSLEASAPRVEVDPVTAVQRFYMADGTYLGVAGDRARADLKGEFAR